MRPTLTDEVPQCNKGRTGELTARRSTPVRSTNHQLKLRTCNCHLCYRKRAVAAPYLTPNARWLLELRLMLTELQLHVD
jgi:hypothetical protein